MNFNFFMDALFPQQCLRCNGAVTNGVICENCRACITTYTSLFCGKCKARIPNTHAICHKNFPYLLGAAGTYSDETIKTLIHHLKFRGIRGAAEPLAEIMVKYISKLDIDLAGYKAVPIPLSAKRKRERGFNQAELIGTIFAKRLAVPLETNVLIRVRHAAPQSSMENAALRRTNVSGCFAATNNSLRGSNIILIDDVTTCGATFFEAARAAKDAGAKKIIALAAAMP